jgi:predicted transcriptional regulator
MEVPLTADQVSRLAQVAKAKGRSADALAQEVLSRYLEEEARFVEAVKLGEAELERGEYLTQEQVGQRIERLFKP